MEQIISPWFFYWINVVDGLGVFFAIATFIFGVTSIISVLFYGCEKTMGIYAEKNLLKKFKKIALMMGPFFIICFFISIFIPSKTTLIQMIVADKLTYNNVEKVLDSGKNIKNELKQDVMDILNAIGEENDLPTNKQNKK